MNNIAVPRIIVAMPIFNRSETALRSLSSVAVDPCVDKIAVFDDGSEESQYERLARYCENYSKIQLERETVNKGYTYTLKKALSFLQDQSAEYLFLCESDMLLVSDWGRIMISGFDTSPSTVCITPMLHMDQLTPNRCEKFRVRSLYGVYEEKGGIRRQIKKPFGSCFSEFPDRQPFKKIGKLKLRFVSNSIGTMVFRNRFLKKWDINDLDGYQGQEDARMSWACFAYNDFDPRSLGVFDPGLALTFGEAGLHGAMALCNRRWIGSFWWRYSWSAALTRKCVRLKIMLMNRLRYLGVLRGGR